MSEAGEGVCVYCEEGRGHAARNVDSEAAGGVESKVAVTRYSSFFLLGGWVGGLVVGWVGG